MRCYVGLDVSLHTTSVCLVDRAGDIIAETEVPTDPKAIAKYLRSQQQKYVRVGLESGSQAEWLYLGLVEARLPVVCIEARHAHGVLKANLNKTDRNDARGIATLMRIGVYRTVHIKTAESRKLRRLLTARRMLLIKAIDIENGIGGLLRGAGLKVRRVAAVKYRAHIGALLAGRDDLAAVIEPLLFVRDVIRQQFDRLDAQMVEAAHNDPVCRRLMTAPGVGPIVAINYRTAIDQPERFAQSRTVGAHLGLTPKTRQSGGSDIRGKISRWGDRELRSMLFAAGMAVLNPRTRLGALKTWGLAVRARTCWAKAAAAIARKLSVILHRMWVSQTDYSSEAAG